MPSFYGPTTGDSVRLGDTDLFAKVEKDLTVHGQEKFIHSVVEKFFVTVWVLVLLRTRAGNPMVADLIISDAIIIDWTGIYKAKILVFVMVRS